MQLVDVRVLSEDTLVDADVVIVGSGPAGLTIARELQGSGLDVVLLESGGRETDPWNDALNEVESIGAPRVLDQTLVRNRVLGGSSATWWGRLATFDGTDFAARAWVPNSGWPIPRSVLEPYLLRSAAYLGAGIADNTASAALALLDRERLDLDPALLKRYLWSYSRDADTRDVVRFGARPEALQLPSVRCFLRATVTHIDTDAAGTRVDRLEVRGPDGRVRWFRAPRVVLCGGGIENARLLLASNRIVPGGVGNTHDTVGRYLMDHPRGPVATFRPRDFAAVQRVLGPFRVRMGSLPTSISPGVALAPALPEAEGLLNCAMWVDGEVSDDDPLRSLAALRRLRSPALHAGRALRSAPFAVETLRRTRFAERSAVRRMSTMGLQAIVEQRPDPDSRVTLSDRRDALGVPLSVIDWRVGGQEARTVRRAARLFSAEMTRLGLPAPDLLPMIADDGAPFVLPDVAHPMGTTRMSSDPRTGVVDEHGAVHGVAGLYVAGSSVFPTGGHANPTQTIVAMAIRLADHLKGSSAGPALRRDVATAGDGRFRERTSDPVERRDKGVSRAAGLDAGGGRPLVLVTGAAGLVGSRLVPRLVGAGYAVRALTSRVPAPQIDGVEWRARDLRQDDLDFRDEVRGCAAVLHLAAEQRVEDDMLRVNAEATGALARAAAAEGVRFFCYTSSISVYGSVAGAQATEDDPVLTTSRDDPTEYWARPALRAYGRTKLLGERALAATAGQTETVIFRPTVIVDEARVAEFLGMAPLRLALAWHQRTHAVNVEDVAEAVLWALERSLARPSPAPGITTYNLADDGDDQTFGDVWRAAGRRAPPVRIPESVGRLLKWVRHGARFPERRSMGYTRFPSARLSAAGFDVVHGLHGITERTSALLRSGSPTAGQVTAEDSDVGVAAPDAP